MWYHTNGSGGQGTVCDEETGRTVAVAYDAQDAPLLAAAPDLLAALQALVVDVTDPNGRALLRTPRQIHLDNARAAIEKANRED